MSANPWPESFSSPGEMTPTSSTSNTPVAGSPTEKKESAVKTAADKEVVIRLRKLLQERIRNAPELFPEIYAAVKPHLVKVEKDTVVAADNKIPGGAGSKSMKTTISADEEEKKPEQIGDNRKTTATPKADVKATAYKNLTPATYNEISKMCRQKLIDAKADASRTTLNAEYYTKLVQDIVKMADELAKHEAHPSGIDIPSAKPGVIVQNDNIKSNAASFVPHSMAPCTPMFGLHGKCARDTKEVAKDRTKAFIEDLMVPFSQSIFFPSSKDNSHVDAKTGSALAAAMEETREVRKTLDADKIAMDRILRRDDGRSHRTTKLRPFPGSVFSEFATGHPPVVSTHEFFPHDTVTDAVFNIEEDVIETVDEVSQLREDTTKAFAKINTKLDKLNDTLAQIQRMLSPYATIPSESDSDNASEDWSIRGDRGNPYKPGESNLANGKGRASIFRF